MSFILDALRRAERERADSKPLRTALATNDNGPALAHRRMVLGMLAVAACAVLVLAHFALRPGAAPHNRLPLAAAPAPGPATRPQPLPQAPTPTQVIVTEPLTQPPQPRQTPAQVVVAERVLVDEAPQTIASLPLHLREQLPRLALDIHVYSAAIERRFVLINGRRYQQGDWLDEGPLIEAITATGVNLVHHDRRFRLSVE